MISTRTPHAGSDHWLFSQPQDGKISTRTPHAGSDYVGNSNIIDIP